MICDDDDSSVKICVIAFFSQNNRSLVETELKYMFYLLISLE